MLGTTQFVNAVIEQKHLSKVFVVRLCGTATGALPPFTGMPCHLKQHISAGYLMAAGGPTQPAADYSVKVLPNCMLRSICSYGSGLTFVLCAVHVALGFGELELASTLL
jgi:hypothetical protein